MRHFTRIIIATAWITATLGWTSQLVQAQSAPTVTDPALTDPGYATRKLRQFQATAPAQAAPTTVRRSINPPGTPLPDCFEPLDKTTYTPVPRNDDGSLGPIALGFDFFLFGTAYNQVYINTNGNITFNAPLTTFVPTGFPIAIPMIAAFWNDVDTRTPATGTRGQAWYRLFNDRLVVTWDSVGRFPELTNFKNTFQIKLFANAGGALAEDVQFAYGDMQWATSTTNTSGGGGFGGPGTTVGVNEGGGGGRFIQTGRFSLDGNAYVDNTAPSGVDYLDYKCIGFRVFSAGNQPPAVSGLPFGGSITVNQGQLVGVNPVFTGPEVGQTVTVSVADGLPCNSTSQTSPGTNPTVEYTVTGAACNVGTHTVTFTATDNGSPARTSVYTLTVVVNPPLSAAVWDGDVSTDYLTAANWVGNTLPQVADSILIPGTAPRFPVLTGTATAGNFRLATGSSLVVAAGSALTLNGYLYCGGPVSGAGEIALGGSNQQRVGGPQRLSIGTLSVGPAGALQTGPLTVQRVLDLSGSLTTRGFACLLASDAQGTAMAINRGTGRVVGNATVQRYLTPGTNAGLGYRHLSTPVDGQTIQSLAGPLFQPVLNAAYNSVGNTATPFPNIFTYNQANVMQSGRPGATDFDMGWRCPASTATPLAQAQGYTVNLRLTSPATVPPGILNTLAFTGTLHNGAYPSGPLPRGPQTESGWHLLGNPYPAPLDWMAAFAGATGLENAVYVFKSTGQYTGSYESFVNGVGGARYIGSSQGFFVRTATAGTPGTLNLTNAARVTTYRNPDVRRTRPNSAPTADQRPLLRLELAGTTGPTEAAYVYFEAGATTGFDARFDAHKLPGGEALYLASGANPNEALSINGLPALTAAGRAVPLRVRLPRPGQYTLGLADLQNLPAAPIQLEDRVSGQWVDLRQLSKYTFSTTALDASGRFVLHIGQVRGVLATQPAVLSAEAVSLWPNPATTSAHLTVLLPAENNALKVSILNILGQPMRALAVPVRGGYAVAALDLKGLAPGVYVVRGESASATFTRSLVVQ